MIDLTGCSAPTMASQGRNVRHPVASKLTHICFIWDQTTAELTTAPSRSTSATLSADRLAVTPRTRTLERLPFGVLATGHAYEMYNSPHVPSRLGPQTIDEPSDRARPPHGLGLPMRHLEVSGACG